MSFNHETEKLVDCIGKIIIREKTPDSTAKALMGSVPHTVKFDGQYIRRNFILRGSTLKELAKRP